MVVRRRKAAAVTTSPTTFTQQVYQHPGVQWLIDVTLQKMTALEAQPWTQFFYDLEGVVGTFQFNLTPWCPGLVPAPGVLNFRLAAPEVGWDSELAVLFDFRFSAVQAL
ncbi:MAG TPA: hypothetical protein VEC14_07310 [Reyranellaceae bacterium]|nr:hypothetical protein [Reyranellaceae bacterium]